MGKMHRFAKQYRPCKRSWRRASWLENDLLVKRSEYLTGQPVILEKFQDILTQLIQFTKDPDSYGLIHADFTDVNFFLNGGRITVFDFDDCEYHWFVYDIAVVLYDTLQWLPHNGMTLDEFGKYFWKYFYAGYKREHILSAFWLQQLPFFLKLRELMLYLFFYKKWDLDNLKEHQRMLLSSYKTNIENDIRKFNKNFWEDI